MEQIGIFGENQRIDESRRRNRLVRTIQESRPQQTEDTTRLIATIEKKVTLKGSAIVTTTHFVPQIRTQHESSRENLKTVGNEFNGYMSANTSRYVDRVVSNWLTAIELNEANKSVDFSKQVYVTFLTLTLPCKQVHGDNTLKNRLLDPLVEWLRNSSGKSQRDGCAVEAYLWRAEAQKNGNIHFHLIIDRWIDHERVRKKWNQIIERLKYITMYRNVQNYNHRNGFQFSESQAVKQIEKLQYVVQYAIKDGKIIPETKYVEHPMVRASLNAIIVEALALSPTEFVKRERAKAIGLDTDTARMLVYRMQHKAWEIGVKNNWSNPNTTDIHKLGNIDSISAYITKYVKKMDIIEPILAKNQRAFVKELDGKKRIYTLKEGGVWENLLDYYDTDAPLYIVEFTSRKVRGKIWGKSRNLSDGENGKKIQAAQFVTETKILYEDERFGRKITAYSHEEEVVKYVEKVKEQIPEAEIIRLAEIIDSDYCEVIPLGKYAERIDHKTKKKVKYFKSIKQIDFLKKLDSPIKTRYLEHYDNIFQMIYGANNYQKAG